MSIEDNLIPLTSRDYRWLIGSGLACIVVTAAMVWAIVEVVRG